VGLRLQFHSSFSEHKHGIRKIKNACKILKGNMKGKDHLRKLDVDGRKDAP
jgi:hypothetical protein